MTTIGEAVAAAHADGRHNLTHPDDRRFWLSTCWRCRADEARRMATTK
jgi:hypothetical protein